MKSLEEYIAMAHRVRLKESRVKPVEARGDVEKAFPVKLPKIPKQPQAPIIIRTAKADVEMAYLSLTAQIQETFPIWCASPHNKAIAGAAMHMDALREKGDTTDLQDTIIEIEMMLLKVFAEDFAKKNKAVKIHSSLLDDDVWLVSNEQTRAHLKAEGLACYLPEELVHLKNNPPDGIRAIHTIKAGLGGTTKPVKSERKR